MNFTALCMYVLTAMAATRFKQATKDWESRGTLHKTPVWNRPRQQVHWYQMMVS